MTTGRLPIGAVASAHGVRGQFKVKPFTSAPRDIAAYGPVWAGDRQLTLTVRGMTANGLVIVSAPEVGDRNACAARRWKLTARLCPTPAMTRSIMPI